MNGPDELQRLWTGGPTLGDSERAKLLGLVERKTRRLDLMITTRNLVECAAALFVAVFFARFALLRATNGPQRIGSLVVAAGAVWIILYLVRHGRGRVALDHSQDLASYTSALLERYDHQIHLLKTAKYWYLLPMYVGLLLATSGILLERIRLGTFGWLDMAGPAFYTAVFAGVWWLNEVHTVRRLQTERGRLVSMTALPPDFQGDAE